MTARSVYLELSGFEVHLMEWGEAGNPALVMWHGLNRNGRDFDELARALSDRYFVLCPDTPGRGLSSWSDDPEAEYTLPTYAGIAVGMLDHYGIEQAHWLGTSMGAQIGMTVAGQVAPERVATLIINDIAPEVPKAALDRIVTYAAELPVFDRVSGAEAWLREVYTPFGPADDAFWRRMTETSVRRMGDGRLTLHYDPRLVGVLDRDRGSTDLWEIYQKIAQPTHVIRGLNSDLLTGELTEKMRALGPKPDVTVFASCGHAPSLARAEDAQLVAGILERLSQRAMA